jgi:hypothetical protein
MAFALHRRRLVGQRMPLMAAFKSGEGKWGRKRLPGFPLREKPGGT